MWFFSFYSLVTSCFACHLYISCKSCTCLSLCKLGHLLSSCLGHWFCMLFKLGSCISKRVRLVGEKESILITISSLPDARLRDKLLLKIEYLVTCKSKATGTSTSKLGYHLQTESLTSLSAQNLFADFAKCDKKLQPSRLCRSHVKLVGRYALCQTWGTCSVHLLFLVTVQ